MKRTYWFGGFVAVVALLLFIDVIFASEGEGFIIGKAAQTLRTLGIIEQQFETLQPTTDFVDYEEIIVKYNVTTTVCVQEDNTTNGTFRCSVYEYVQVEHQRIERIKSGSVELKGVVIPKGDDEWGVYVGNGRVDFVKVNAGLHRANPQSFVGCQKEGGMDCRTLIFKDTKNYDEYVLNSEKLNLQTSEKVEKVLK